jgi:hypothetical protein
MMGVDETMQSHYMFIARLLLEITDCLINLNIEYLGPHLVLQSSLFLSLVPFSRDLDPFSR